MAKRRVKKRTHVPPGKAGAQGTKNGAASMNRSPKSMVIRIGAGQVGSSMSQLAKDVRSMMEPDTASRLKVCLSFMKMLLKFSIYQNANSFDRNGRRTG